MQQSRLNHEDKGDHAEDNPALSHVVERNIRTIIQMRLQAALTRSLQNRVADTITAFSGRMVFVYVHIVWLASGFCSIPDVSVCVLSTHSPTAS